MIELTRATMTFSSPSLVRHLEEFARQIAAAPQHMAALYAAFQRASISNFVATHLEANRHVCAMAETVAQLKAQVVPDDGLGATVESISELVLRAQRRVVLAELGALGELADEPSMRSRLPSVAFNPFERLEDWISFVGHEVNGGAQVWIDYRGRAEDRAEYRAALRKAHAAMRCLAERSKATPFLLDAAVRTDWPELQAPCSRIRCALTIPFDVEPDMTIVVIGSRTPELAGRPS